MHADLVKLLDLQAKDAAVAEVERRLDALRQETRRTGSGAAARARSTRGRPARGGRGGAAAGRAGGQDRELPGAAGAAAAAAGARAEPEGSLHPHGGAGPGALGDGQGGERLGPQRRRGHPGPSSRRRKRSATLAAVAERRRRRSEPAGGAADRARGGAGRRRGRSGRRARPGSTRSLRTRYERLRKARSGDVVVPLVGGSCGACHTSIPLNRRSQIRAGTLLDGCEGCGAILYPPETARVGSDAPPG